MESMLANMENCKKMGNEDEEDVKDQGRYELNISWYPF